MTKLTKKELVELKRLNKKILLTSSATRKELHRAFDLLRKQRAEEAEATRS